MTLDYKYLMMGCFLVVSAVAADTVTMTENLGAGKTFSETGDAHIEWSNSHKEYNFGGNDLMQSGGARYSTEAFYRVSLLKFDLSIVDNMEVVAVNSAILRINQTDGGDNPKVAHQLLQNWDQGTGNGSYSTPMDGANCYVKNHGQVVEITGLTEISHLGHVLYYFDGASGLATNPINGTGHYISRWRSGYTYFRNGDVAGRRLADAGNLDTLALSPPKADQSYFYDQDACRVYVNFNNYVIHWWKSSDLWADSVWDGTATQGPRSGSLDSTEHFDITDPNPVRGWYEIDVTGAVSNWLMNGQGNYGVRIVNFGTWMVTDTFATSENENGLRPELIIDFEPPPPPGLTIMGE